MAIFNSYVNLPEGNNHDDRKSRISGFIPLFYPNVVCMEKLVSSNVNAE